MERRLKNRALPKIRCKMHPVPPSALFSPIFSRAREKIGPSETTGSCKFAAVNHSGASHQLPLHKGALDARHRKCGKSGRQPLSLGCAEPAPLEGEPRVPHRRKYSELGGNLSVSLRLTAPLEGEPFLCACEYIVNFAKSACKWGKVC